MDKVSDERLAEWAVRGDDCGRVTRELLALRPREAALVRALERIAAGTLTGGRWHEIATAALAPTEGQQPALAGGEAQGAARESLRRLARRCGNCGCSSLFEVEDDDGKVTRDRACTECGWITEPVRSKRAGHTATVGAAGEEAQRVLCATPAACGVSGCGAITLFGQPCEQEEARRRQPPASATTTPGDSKETQ